MAAIRLTALGDSFVEGRGDPAPLGPGWHGWVPRLAEMLGVPGSAVRNLGAHQATTQVVADRQLPAALVNKSPLCGVVVGVNDLITDYAPARLRRNLTAIFGRLAGAETVVFTATYANIPGNLPLPDAFRRLLLDRFAEANDTLREVAAATGALCIDVTTEPQWSEASMWDPDGLHPSPRGHQWFAEEAAALLERAAGIPVLALPTRIR